MRLLVSALIVTCCVVSPTAAQQGAPFETLSPRERTALKHQYSLFRATPTAMLRDFATDRPDKTESPYTVDAGRFQVELDLLTVSRDRVRDGTTDELTTGLGVTPINVKFGLRHNVDVQFVLEPYVRERTSVPGSVLSNWRGTGDLAMRVKVNVWGNEGGTTALALMPFVALARAETGEKRQFAAGLIVPLAVDLGGGWGFGTMAELDVEKHATVAPYHLAGVLSATVGRDLSERVGFYTELWALDGRFTDFTATWDTGLTYALAPNVQLDGGFNVGLNRAADAVNPFVGLSFRL